MRGSPAQGILHNTSHMRYFSWFCIATAQEAQFITMKLQADPVSTGNTFQDLPRLRETADNTEHYI